MPDFVPVNRLEINLRALLRNKNTPSWSFYTPLAAAPLWIITRHYPELDGSDQIAPEGQHPDICIFTGKGDSHIGLYTAECRVREAFAKFNCPPGQMTWVSAPGYRLLRFLSGQDAWLWINLGLPECQYPLDPDMIDILLARPEPAYENPGERADFEPAEDPAHYLGPLREFLGRQPTVRAAWIYGRKPDSPPPAGFRAYEIGLVMQDPEDRSLLADVEAMVKALTPVQMEWTTAVMMTDDDALRKLVTRRRPFYVTPDFLKPG